MSDSPTTNSSGNSSGFPFCGWLAIAYGGLIVLGVVALRLPGATIAGNELSLERAVLTAVNAATLTGFQQSVAIDQYGTIGQATVLVLMIAGTLLTLIIGGVALSRALRLPYDAGTVVRGTAYTFVFAVAIGTCLLLENSRGFAASMSQAASAFGNAGVFLGNLPGVTEARTHVALLPLAALGGLGIPVILELTDAAFGRRALSKHSRIVLALLAGTYIFGVLALSPWKLEENYRPENGTETIATGSALSIDSRTCGLPLATIGSLSRPAQWVLIVMMMIGAAPAGTAGGMKVTAMFHGWRGTRRALRREGGMRITGIAATWIVGYVLIVFATFLALLASMPETSADRLAMIAASAVGNVGLSHEPLSVRGAALTTLVLAMLIGRAGPLAVLWWVAATCEDADVGV